MQESWRQRADAALVALTRDRWASLTGYGYLLTGDRQEAEDLAQEAIVRTFARARSIDPAAMEGYIRRAMATIAIDGHRRRGRWRDRLHLLAGPSSTQGPEVGGPRDADVHDALAALPRRQRTCVVLRFYDEMSIAEVAGTLGLATGTVKRYLSEAMHELESRLGPVGESVAAEPVLIEGDHR
jgi:RNA polymerase sigma-70 factor (ECF subfamily)